jgi:regulation of enolase protein 1 (concanavalin A-like superfamily)
VKNIGSTGIETVNLYVNGEIVNSKEIPLVEKNSELVTFELLLSDPGEYRFWINNSQDKKIKVVGNPIAFIYDSLKLSSDIIPEGEELTISAQIKKVSTTEKETKAILYLNNEIISEKTVQFEIEENASVIFNLIPKAGNYMVRIGNSRPLGIRVYSYKQIDLSRAELETYCTSRAEPCDLNIDQENNKYWMETAGTDFFHGEDAYASIYLKEPIKGNFIATVKVTGFGDRTHEWYRAGLFTRNDMTKSFETGMGSKGSVLMFVSPRRGGIHWDEYGDGCMHKANSENLPKINTYPMWIKLERKGNRFSGYISYDGENWIISRDTNDLPGINEAVHLGLAAGGPDQRVYSVQFEDFNLLVEK